MVSQLAVIKWSNPCTRIRHSTVICWTHCIHLRRDRGKCLRICRNCVAQSCSDCERKILRCDVCRGDNIRYCSIESFDRTIWWWAQGWSNGCGKLWMVEMRVDWHNCLDAFSNGKKKNLLGWLDKLMICKSFSMSVTLYSVELVDRLFNICSNHSEFTPAKEKIFSLLFRFFFLFLHPIQPTRTNWRWRDSSHKIKTFCNKKSQRKSSKILANLFFLSSYRLNISG